MDKIMTMPMSAILTTSHIFAGEYEYQWGDIKTAVDIGANVGAFAIFIIL